MWTEESQTMIEGGEATELEKEKKNYTWNKTADEYPGKNDSREDALHHK